MNLTMTPDGPHYAVHDGKRRIGSIVALRGRWQYVARVEDKQLAPATHETPEAALAYVKAGLAERQV